MIEKESLAHEEPLEAALRKIIHDDSYRQNAMKLAQMIADRPFPMKDNLRCSMEFLAKYGPLDCLSHQGAKFSFVEYYLIDVFAFLALGIVLLVAITICASWKILGVVLKHVSIRKVK
ncbi:hypothetical protein PENTCL1PPCAC_16698, partial [Pristionchus entomophagus]